MTRLGLIAKCVALVVASLLVSASCTNVGDCPAKSAITQNGACSGDSLECPYDITETCGSATQTVTTSCVCTNGQWACPSGPVTCGDDGGNAVEAGDDGSDGASSSTDGSDGASPAAEGGDDGTSATDAAEGG